MRQTITNCGTAPEKISADTGYFSEANIAEAQIQHIDAYIATRRKKHHGEQLPPPPGPVAELTVKQRMAAKLATEQGAAVYARRKVNCQTRGRPRYGAAHDVRRYQRYGEPDQPGMQSDSETTFRARAVLR